MTSTTGGCLCGNVRYECSAEPTLMGNCHCRDCQRATGSAFFPFVVIPAAAFSLTQGEPKYHIAKSDSGNTVTRGFCSECGSFLFAKLSALPEIVSLTAANLDDPSRFKPSMDIFVSSAQPWDHMNPEVPKLPRGPSF